MWNRGRRIQSRDGGSVGATVAGCWGVMLNHPNAQPREFAAPAEGSCPFAHAKRRSLRLLVTTDTLLKAIAPAATMGLRRPAAARGIAAVL